MSAGIIKIGQKYYQMVSLRVANFREKHPIESGWRIITNIHTVNDEVVVIRAKIVDDKGITVATGTAEEYRGSSQVNETSALENCETSAIGRALAAAGYGGEEFASANEVVNAIHQQNNKPKTAKVNGVEIKGLAKGTDHLKKSAQYEAFAAAIDARCHSLIEESEEIYSMFGDRQRVVAWMIGQRYLPPDKSKLFSLSEDELKAAYHAWNEHLNQQLEKTEIPV